jgi:sporulation protein YabP
MDKVKEIEASFNHGISLAERKNVVVTGVKKIESFDNEEFLMDTTLGGLSIKGEGLEIIKLDTYQGDISIKGKIDSFSYLEKDNKKQKNESVFSKLFK